MAKKVNERFGQDGTNAIAHPKTANRTNKPATYYLTVGENESVTNYDGFVMANKQLTKSLSKNDFSHAAKTIKPEVIIAAAKEMVKRYGKDKYIHVWRDKYSYGPMTGKQHGREGVVDIWIPSIKAWKYGLELSNIAEAEKVNEFENSPLIKGTGYKGTNSSTANSCAQDAVATTLVEGKWDCIVKKENNDWNVYEKADNHWVATFGDEEMANTFAKQYPSMVEKYLQEKESDTTQVNEEYSSDEGITINDMLSEAKKKYPHNSSGGKTSPIVGIIDGHLADFTNVVFLKRNDIPDSGTFFLHDGTKASLSTLDEQTDAIMHAATESKTESQVKDELDEKIEEAMKEIYK